MYVHVEEGGYKKTNLTGYFISNKNKNRIYEVKKKAKKEEKKKRRKEQRRGKKSKKKEKMIKRDKSEKKSCLPFLMKL